MPSFFFHKMGWYFHEGSEIKREAVWIDSLLLLTGPIGNVPKNSYIISGLDFPLIYRFFSFMISVPASRKHPRP